MHTLQKVINHIKVFADKGCVSSLDQLHSDSLKTEFLKALRL